MYVAPVSDGTTVSDANELNTNPAKMALVKVPTDILAGHGVQIKATNFDPKTAKRVSAASAVIA